MVEYLVWDQGVAGSNPVFPIDYEDTIGYLFLFTKEILRVFFFVHGTNLCKLAVLKEWY